MAIKLFSYEAIDGGGKTVTGKRTAASEQKLHEMLAEKGLVLTKAIIITKKSKDLTKAKVGPKHVIQFTHHFVALFAAGVPMLRSLQDLQRGMENPIFKDVVEEITESVQGGTSLADAMKNYPKVFDTIYTNIVEAGEATGRLDQVLENLADYMEWIQETKGTIATAVIYPCILLTAITGLVIIMLTFLIPRLAKIFEGAGVDLPLPTRIVLACSAFLRNYWWALLIGIFVFVTSFGTFSRTTRGRLMIDAVKLRLPVFGPLIRKSCAARFTSTLSSLLNAGIDILRAMEIVGEVVGNAVISKAIVESREKVKEGTPLAQAIDETGVFQPLVISMIEAGETTGKLDETLKKVNRFYDREIPQAVKRMLAMMEPCLICVSGVIVGFIIASALLPIFKLITAIK